MKIGRSRAARKWVVALRRAVLAIVAVAALYLIAAVIGSLVPRNADWQEPRQGILIFLRTNGVHADIVLPASAAGLDLYRLVPPADIRDPEKADGWIAFGWGQREFYIETPRWADLTVRSALRSVLGGDALMHVEHLGRPSVSGAMRSIRLDPASYRRLVASVACDFVREESGRTVPLRGRGYGSSDISTRRAAATMASRPPTSGRPSGLPRPASRSASGRPSPRASCGASAMNGRVAGYGQSARKSAHPLVRARQGLQDRAVRPVVAGALRDETLERPFPGLSSAIFLWIVFT